MMVGARKGRPAALRQELTLRPTGGISSSSGNPQSAPEDFQLIESN